jgi:hypothetical protein
MWVSDEQSKAFARPELFLHRDWSVLTASSLSKLSDYRASTKPTLDLAIAFQDRPRQFTQQSVLRCYAALPLLRIVLVLGPWCDGDLRTPGRLAGVHVMRFDEAELRLASIVEEFRQGKGVLARPLTAQGEQPRMSASSCATTKPLQVGVYMPGRLAVGVTTCIEALGHTAVLLRDLDSGTNALDLLLVDGETETPAASREIDAPIIRLRGFSRQEDGMSISKNFCLADLEAAIRRTTGEANDEETIRESLTSQ